MRIRDDSFTRAIRFNKLHCSSILFQKDMIEVALINVLDSFSKYSNHDLSYLSGSSYYISIIRIDKIQSEEQQLEGQFTGGVFLA